jgi:hypothetical protein
VESSSPNGATIREPGASPREEGAQTCGNHCAAAHKEVVTVLHGAATTDYRITDQRTPVGGWTSEIGSQRSEASSDLCFCALPGAVSQNLEKRRYQVWSAEQIVI